MLPLVLAACSAAVPYRSDNFAPVSPTCKALYERFNEDQEITGADLGSACWKSPVEQRDAYDLLFMEFDDEGWIANPPRPASAAPEDGDRLAMLLERLKRAIDVAGEDGVSLVVFVHGWHHTAMSNDGNVRSFRALLNDVSTIEQEANPAHARRTVGLYVGWRGDSIEVPGLNMITFWDRKGTAQKIAQGSVQEFFGRLAVLRENYGNHIRMLTIGHSFGGLIVFEALNASFVRSIARSYPDVLLMPPATAEQTGRTAGDPPPLVREGDLVVLANPAFEGTRYEALRTASRRIPAVPPRMYPLLVVATSEKDLATRIAFPAARIVSTVFEVPMPSAGEYEANIDTVGHSDRYQTHSLGVCAGTDPKCNEAPCAVDAPVETASVDNRRKKIKKEFHFAQALTQTKNLTPGHFGKGNYLCQGLLLTAVPNGNWSPEGNPFWVVHTSGDVMKDHDDIFNERFISFVRTVYTLVRQQESR